MQQTLTRTREKVLLGVAHRYEEYPLVVDSLRGFQFSRIGLELSPRELHASLHRDPLIKWPVFFGSLAAHYNGLGIEITPSGPSDEREDGGAHVTGRLPH